eukprot:2828523-Rhodomonas_salina.3
MICFFLPSSSSELSSEFFCSMIWIVVGPESAPTHKRAKSALSGPAHSILSPADHIPTHPSPTPSALHSPTTSTSSHSPAEPVLCFSACCSAGAPLPHTPPTTFCTAPPIAPNSPPPPAAAAACCCWSLACRSRSRSSCAFRSRSA